MIRRNISEMDRFTVGIIGIGVIVTLILVSLNSGAIIRSFTSDTLTAEFPEAGNLQVADEVRLAGVTVGKVLAIQLDGDRVAVELAVEQDGVLGVDTRASIKTASPLGKKFVELTPAGPGRLEDGATIPLARTNSPYDVTQILSRLTSQTAKIDTPRLADALRTLASSFADTPPELRTALTGVGRISETISSRDTELRTLLANAASVTGVLADRRQQIQKLLSDGNLLLAELYARREAIRALLVNATTALDEVQRFAVQNGKVLGPALDELRGVTDLLIRNERNISGAITGLNVYVGSLGDAIGGGPWFYAYIPNLVPSNLLPPLSDLLDPNVGSGLPAPFNGINLPVAPAAGAPQGGPR